MRIIQTIIDDIEKPVRLDLFLAERFDYLSRSAWQKEIRAGKLFVSDKQVLNPAHKLKPGEKLSFEGGFREEPRVDASYSILFEDDALLAVSKSGNIPVHPAGRYFEHSLTRVIEKERNEKLYLIHRLDRETSGLILFAKDARLAQALASKWDNTEKVYLALVHGVFNKDGVCEVPIGAAYSQDDPRSDIVRKKRRAFAGAQESAKTEFRLEREIGNYSIVRAKLFTGRMHQLRVHLRYLNFPIVGDKIYGKNERYYLEFIKSGMSQELLQKLEFTRCALHSHRLTLSHPLTGSALDIVSPLPKDLTKFIATL